jgi:Flp pilus assembly protein TadG
MRSLSHARRTRLPERPRRNRQRGGAAVEFALVLPIFCAVVFGLIDYGWYFYERFTLAAAIRDGLRYAVTLSQTATNPTPLKAATDRATADMINAGFNVPNGAFSATSNGEASPGTTMTLSGTFTFTPLVNFVPLPTKPMKYQMTMLFEQQL